MHRDLDDEAAAHGWPADLSDDEILERLFEVKQERAGIAKAPARRPQRPEHGSSGKARGRQTKSGRG
jgi:hypothetical protein